MPANIPSPVVGAGGGGSRPWYESLLLTLASQGPGQLMQFLEQRQAGAQAAANDAASQYALQAFAGTANPMEAGAIAAAGGQPGIAPTGSAQSPSGIQMPSIRAVEPGNQPNMQGMQQGVAGPLLAQLSQLRTNQAQQDASGASVKASEAQTAATTQSTEQARILFPLEQQRIQASIRQGDAAVRASDAATARDTYELTWAQGTESLRKRALAAQALGAEGDARSSQAAAAGAERDLRMFAHNRVQEDLQRITETVFNVKQMFPEVDARTARSRASTLITGVPNATAKDLRDLYTAAANDATVDLDKLVHDRVMGTFGLSPEDIVSLDSILGASGGDTKQALKTARDRGASVTQLAKMAGYYLAITGEPVELPDEQRSGIQGVVRQLLDRTVAPEIGALYKGTRSITEKAGGALLDLNIRKTNELERIAEDK